MRYAQLFALIEASGLSPEEFANTMGVSGMTLRRWALRPRGAHIDKLYLPAIQRTCERLLIEGHVEPGDPTVEPILAEGDFLTQRATLARLGVPTGERTNFKDGFAHGMTAVLSEIAADGARRDMVDRGMTRIERFKAKGKEWARVIGDLVAVLRSRQTPLAHKFVAYGAFFYLLMPVDLIPDQIPGFGLLDDFALLRIAADYYLRSTKGRTGTAS